MQKITLPCLLFLLMCLACNKDDGQQLPGGPTIPVPPDTDIPYNASITINAPTGGAYIVGDSLEIDVTASSTDTLKTVFVQLFNTFDNVAVFDFGQDYRPAQTAHIKETILIPSPGSRTLVFNASSFGDDFNSGIESKQTSIQVSKYYSDIILNSPGMADHPIGNNVSVDFSLTTGKIVRYVEVSLRNVSTNQSVFLDQKEVNNGTFYSDNLSIDLSGKAVVGDELRLTILSKGYAASPEGSTRTVEFTVIP